ncbi:MAG: hypothetical protein JWP69_2080 [Flaviaesturariibacter sp.]|nr:hypothetical protein [Flaviaesturariibacter sp.]
MRFKCSCNEWLQNSEERDYNESKFGALSYIQKCITLSYSFIIYIYYTFTIVVAQSGE